MESLTSVFVRIRMPTIRDPTPTVAGTQVTTPSNQLCWATGWIASRRRWLLGP